MFAVLALPTSSQDLRSGLMIAVLDHLLYVLYLSSNCDSYTKLVAVAAKHYKVYECVRAWQ
jgi:hypothetical protein